MESPPRQLNTHERRILLEKVAQEGQVVTSATDSDPGLVFSFQRARWEVHTGLR